MVVRASKNENRPLFPATARAHFSGESEHRRVYRPKVGVRLAASATRASLKSGVLPEITGQPVSSMNRQELLAHVAKTYGDELLAFCLMLCAIVELQPEDGEDVFQETVFRMARCRPSKLSQIQKMNAWIPWLRSIARNLVFDKLKAMGPRQRRELHWGVKVAMQTDPDPADELVQAEALELLNNALKTHCKEEMQVVWRLRVEGVKWRKIAKILCCSVRKAQRAQEQANAILSEVLKVGAG